MTCFQFRFTFFLLVSLTSDYLESPTFVCTRFPVTILYAFVMFLFVL